ncbi:hydantoinase B/oxoprolinase family protein [Pseudaminobacter sp. 19-2017]|uniref:Hydantoinase B/oxoprolinase family protein n=1 Tax=Pseudaminobacter soli (ex Zhang et al. 2022) TaxID=2831468 RepID=A0A942EAS5_9HYPH|nr:hydantoinase B/oxoprolinase family protein [Pseudaminobacter soli]MBS3651627.1 hydantoinase B/oxoprolinase family protein [Pseudaminobacter soli]
MTALPVGQPKGDDFINFELFKNELFSIADEMAVTICRTTYSGVLRDNMDFSTGIADAQGRLVAQGLTLPVHLGSIRTALEAVMNKYAGDIGDGDVFILNDPFEGGMHLPDIFILKPIFSGGELIAFAATTAHHVDVGGHVPGSNSVNSTEIFQEGLRIPPLKLVNGGKHDVALWGLIQSNVRLPIQLLGDLRAQLAACEIAQRKVLALTDRYGLGAARSYMAEITDYTERLARAALRELPDGEFDFEDWIDDDGMDVGVPIRLFVTVRKKGETVEFDWTGSAPQVRGAINCTLSVTEAASYTALRSILPGGIPNNDGVFRVIRTIAPKGSIANVAMPGACAARALTGFRMVDCAFGALSKMVPDRVFAASDGGNVGVTVAGFDRSGSRFVYVDFSCGTWGGRPWADGIDGISNIFVNMASQSVEQIESEHPIEILAYEFAQDRCGAGKFRGGAPFYRDYRIKVPDAILQIRADRQTIRPYGLHGGKAGKPGSVSLNPNTSNDPIGSKVTINVREGDEFRYVLPGGGGWGDPLQRDPVAVLKDVRNEIVSASAARQEYGVVLDEATLSVDQAATEKLRASLSAERGNATEFVNWVN